MTDLDFKIAAFRFVFATIGVLLCTFAGLGASILYFRRETTRATTTNLPVPAPMGKFQPGNPWRFTPGNPSRIRTEARSIGGVGYTRQVNGKSGRTMRYLKATTKGNSR